MEYQPIEKQLLRSLTKAEAHVLLHQGTEPPFSGELNNNTTEGSYYCRQCGSPLFYSDSKFDSGSGWPSFDDPLPNSVVERPDNDGVRLEVVCSTCSGHLGHLFRGERFTPKNKRYCLNSIALEFREGAPQAEAIYAGGCFWGVEYYFSKLKGVLSVTSGYTGGEMENPTYQDVLSQTTGHYEAVRVFYDPRIIAYEELTKYFFEIHDPTQANGQGPDIGPQYRSALFYRNESEWETALYLIELLKKRGLKVVTEVKSAKRFWPAEDYHQNYYAIKGSLPYCHSWQKRF
ncbi:MAG: bifunctional methionine sulfoxide reductase B/A protein [Sphaerochaetaceae bacterium]|jgi:peptide methionine sulfoxide reductase msrA/msrB|nr:bifunctional methionine sulfoxide reductase B/A protein [Spirochaetales bacterium]